MMNKFISFNFNSFKPIAKVKHSVKITEFADYVFDKYGELICIGIQEFITGDGKYLDELYEAFGKKYYVITPPSFDYRTHKRSLVTVTLLKKSIVETYEVIDIGHCLPNRISYLRAYIDGEPWYIMNCYMVQTANFSGKADWFIAQRKEQKEMLWSEVMEELAKQKDSRIITLGDFQESSDSSHIKELKELGYKEATAGLPTVRNDFFAEKNIDHILLSARAWDEFKPAGFALDGDLIDEISDHCLLVIMSA